jgi:hypothetical protein
LASSRFRLDRTLGPGVVQWMERELVHGPGDVQGQPAVLDDEQVAFVLRAYEIDDRGRRKIRRAVYSRSKGRAKSEFGAWITCAEALGPVRFRGWDHDGSPMGGAVMSPFIRCAATEEGQADNVYAPVEYILREGPISRTEGLDVGITRTFLPGGGKIMPITGKSTSKDGGKETFAVFDETHLYVAEELKRLHATIRRNLAKRRAAEPWSLELTTMYAPDEYSIAESSHDYAQKVAEGIIKDEGFLFDHRAGPVEFDWDDDEQLRAALVQAYGAASEWMDIERLIAEARDPQTTEEDFRRYFLNQPTRRATAWLGMGAWTACEDAERPLPGDRELVVLGFDGSYNRDSTGLVGCTLDGHVFLVKAWERPPKAPRDWVVDREDVHLTVDRAMRRWQVLELACDPSQWHSELAEWDRLYGSPPVVEYKNVPSNMAPACSTFYGAVANTSLTHDGNPVLRRHLQNAVTKETRDGAYITKDGRNSPRKIDVAIAAVMAYDRAMVNAGNMGSSGFTALSDDELAALNP